MWTVTVVSVFSFTITPHQYAYCNWTPVLFINMPCQNPFVKPCIKIYLFQLSMRAFIKNCKVSSPCVGPSFKSVCLRWHAVTTPTHPFLCASEEKIEKRQAIKVACTTLQFEWVTFKYKQHWVCRPQKTKAIMKKLLKIDPTLIGNGTLS